jgi:hypothetical protein
VGRVGGVARVENARVTDGGFDADVEQLAEASDVAAGGEDFIDDVAIAQIPGGEAGLVPGEAAADRDEPWGRAPVDEQ